ncbi:MAG: hypothetical protein JRG94_22535, partial [Deltaproteobacteria bacterium]|nr:hypothetical protein [Deltaproteobacteria bacterium]
IEPNSFKAYFWDRVESSLGTGEAARRFIAITDPGTALDELAQRENFSSIAYGIPSIGGRFSALSAFGMIPAASLGIDPADFLARTQLMVDSCSRSVPPARNPGVELGVILGTLAQQGRDKLTLVTSPAISSLGAWLEQLIAESTGKQDRGIVPVAGEQLASPDQPLIHAPSTTPGSRHSKPRDIRSFASTSRTNATSGKSSTAGRSPRPSPAPSCRSTPSTSRMSRRPRSPHSS